jgi:beta-xylosidase
MAPPAQADAALYSNPVIKGDFPDPSVLQAGGAYWATSTSGDWSPTFPLQRSTDLVNWTAVGAIFDRAPTWTAGAYWAPALSVLDGRYVVYYAARRHGGKPCIGVATAATGAGPYRDRGPILCPPAGAIDPQVIAVSARRRMLLYKQMGTGGPVRIVTLSRDGLRVGAHDVALLRPTQPWEGGVTENPFLVSRPDGYYLLYSGGHCCRPPCTYATAVARSPTLLGPYVKAPGVLLRGNASWMCPGGAGVVTDPLGRAYLAYHAYVRGDPSLGRQMLLDALDWGADGWPVVGSGAGPSAQATSLLAGAQRTSGGWVDDFSERALWPGWQWPFDRRPSFTVGGALALRVVPGDETAAFVARMATRPAYVATAVLERAALRPGVTGGLALLRSGAGGTIGIAVNPRRSYLWRREDARRTILASVRPAPSQRIWLRFVVPGDGTATAQMSLDGAAWTTLGAAQRLPAGFDAPRIALAGRGPRSAVARFDMLQIDPYTP